MPLFSERNKLLPEPILQINSLDTKSRNMFYNLVEPIFYGENYESDDAHYRRAAWHYFFHEIDYTDFRFDQFYKKWFFDIEWYQIFDLIEWLYGILPNIEHIDQKRFEPITKYILIKNNIGFSFVDGVFVPITNEIEMDSLQETIENGNDNVEMHFRKAVTLFSDRENPDYINCMKESISAVEAMLRIVLNTDKGTVGELLKSLNQSFDYPTPLKDAWLKMYGYTSDNNGIRHATREGETINIDFNFAKYFLVTCSAFINYLKGLK